MSEDSGIRGPNHALLCGILWGALARAFAEEARAPDVKIEQQSFVELIDTPEGAHTNRIRVTRPSGTYIVTVEPEDVREP